MVSQASPRAIRCVMVLSRNPFSSGGSSHDAGLVLLGEFHQRLGRPTGYALGPYGFAALGFAHLVLTPGPAIHLGDAEVHHQAGRSRKPSIGSFGYPRHQSGDNQVTVLFHSPYGRIGHLIQGGDRDRMNHGLVFRAPSLVYLNHHGAFELGRAEQVERDVLRLELRSKGVGQSDHRVLRGTVGGVTKGAEQPGHGADVDQTFKVLVYQAIND